MSETSPIYGANTASLSAFPEELRATLHLIEKNRSNEVAQTLANFVASSVHPDFVCNLADFGHLDTEVKAAALAFFDYCLKVGLSLQEQASILQWVRPHLSVPASH